MASRQTIYVPKSGCKKIEFPNGGHLLRVSFHVETLQKFLSDQLASGEFVSEKGYLSINLKERRTPSDWGDTHFAELDTWRSSEFKSKDSRSSKISAAVERSDTEYVEYVRLPPERIARQRRGRGDDDPIKPDLKSDDIPF